MPSARDLITEVVRLRARLQYVCGDHAGALESLRQTAERFQDPRGMTVAELIRRFRMAGLHGT